MLWPWLMDTIGPPIRTTVTEVGPGDDREGHGRNKVRSVSQYHIFKAKSNGRFNFPTAIIIIQAQVDLYAGWATSDQRQSHQRTGVHHAKTVFDTEENRRTKGEGKECTST